MIDDNEHYENGLEKFFSFADVAEAFDVHVRTIHRWVDSGALVAYRIGGRRRISQSDLDAFLAARREG